MQVKKVKRETHWFARDWRLYVMLILPVAFYLIFCYKPMAGLIIAFQKCGMVLQIFSPTSELFEAAKIDGTLPRA